MTPPLKVGALPGRLTATGLRLPQTLSFEDWEAAGRFLLQLNEACQFALGDWLSHGEWRYGEKYRAALEKLELRYDAVRDYAYVAGNVPAAIRRPDLSWKHHRAVAKLIPADQETWLARAAAKGWTVRELLEQLRPEPLLAAGETLLEQFRLTVPQPSYQRWQQAADKAGSSLAEWAVAVLDAEAGANG